MFLSRVQIWRLNFSTPKIELVYSSNLTLIKIESLIITFVILKSAPSTLYLQESIYICVE